MTLKQLRQQNKKTVAEVAKVLGVTPPAVVNYESGIRRIGLEQILILSELYQESAECIIKAQLNSQFCLEDNRQKLHKGHKTF